RGRGELAHAIEEVRLVLVRKVRLLGAQDDANLVLLAQTQAHPRVHDEVLARPFGQDDLFASRAKNLEACVYERFLDARCVGDERLGHRYVMWWRGSSCVGVPRARKPKAKLLRGGALRQEGRASDATRWSRNGRALRACGGWSRNGRSLRAC